MPLHLAVDRCDLDFVTGWIDDDGPVQKLDLELNGEFVCSVCPTMYRPDLEAAGIGDGRRGFAVSLLGHFRLAQLDTNRLSIKRDGEIVYEGPIEGANALLGRLTDRLARAEERIDALDSARRWEQYRLEAALFEAEHLSGLREEFLRAKATPKYWAVYECDEPVVSVCITTMNRAELLIERALSSLQAQTYKNLQIIIVGDHCTDDTAERVAQLGDPRISFVNLLQRGPYPRPGVARWQVAGTYPHNHALSLVTGQFVTHLDEDDTFEQCRVEFLLQKIKELRADLVFHPFLWEQPDGSWVELGNGIFEHAATGNGMVFYHHWLTRVPCDVYAYRFGEPGDWNRFRKFKTMRAVIKFVPGPLTRHYKFPVRDPFVPQEGEEFLD